MKVTVIPMVISALGTMPISLIRRLQELEIIECAETIKATVLLRSTRIPRKVLETWGKLLSTKPQWKTISKRWSEKLSRSKIIIIIIMIIICVTVIPIAIGTLGTVTEFWKGWWKNWKSEDESRPSQQQHCYDRLWYWVEFWSPEGICSNSDYSENFRLALFWEDRKRYYHNNNLSDRVRFQLKIIFSRFIDTISYTFSLVKL